MNKTQSLSHYRQAYVYLTLCSLFYILSMLFSYGFGFVDYENEADAKSAIDKLNGKQIQNKKIKVGS